jgi:uncharacterized membrane protein
MLRIGLLMAALAVVAIGLGWIWFHEITLVFTAMTGLNWLVGRAAGMSFGYASGLPHLVVIPANMIIETMQVLLVFPFFVLSVDNLLDLPRLKPFLDRLHASAENRRGHVLKFGVVGLFLFVFMPFWMTGPVVGAIIGHLLGIRPWTNITVVLSATFVAIGVWGLLLNELSTWAATYDSLAPFALVAAAALIVFSSHYWQRRKSAKHNGSRA